MDKMFENATKMVVINLSDTAVESEFPQYCIDPEDKTDLELWDMVVNIIANGPNQSWDSIPIIYANESIDEDFVTLCGSYLIEITFV